MIILCNEKLTARQAAKQLVYNCGASLAEMIPANEHDDIACEFWNMLEDCGLTVDALRGAEAEAVMQEINLQNERVKNFLNI